MIVLFEVDYHQGSLVLVVGQLRYVTPLDINMTTDAPFLSHAIRSGAGDFFSCPAFSYSPKLLYFLQAPPVCNNTSYSRNFWLQFIPFRGH